MGRGASETSPPAFWSPYEWDTATRSNHRNAANGTETHAWQPRRADEKSIQGSPYQELSVRPRTRSSFERGHLHRRDRNTGTAREAACAPRATELGVSTTARCLLPAGSPRTTLPSGEDLGFPSATGRRPKHSAPRRSRLWVSCQLRSRIMSLVRTRSNFLKPDDSRIKIIKFHLPRLLPNSEPQGSAAVLHPHLGQKACPGRAICPTIPSLSTAPG